MQDRAARDHPSPVLSSEQVREILVERNAAMGAAGGAVGGAIGGGLPGAVGGASGGHAGGRIGARLFTRVKGLTRTLPVPCTDAAIAIARGVLAPVAVAEAPASTVVGIVGSGALGMNAAVVQLVWADDRVDVTAHGLEGIIDQRTAAGAIDTIEATLTGRKG